MVGPASVTNSDIGESPNDHGRAGNTEEGARPRWRMVVQRTPSASGTGTTSVRFIFPPGCFSGGNNENAPGANVASSNGGHDSNSEQSASTALHCSQRHRRYDRGNGRDWPPSGWEVVWNADTTRRWAGYSIPDDVPNDLVWAHLTEKYGLQGPSVCRWEGCSKTKEDRLLRRHVESVHLRMKLKCQGCGVQATRPDSRRSAKHGDGCPYAA